ncbi:UNVERIFIED_CONTAM: hypothetical protein FKN15_048814 [Acipenser sinensis]
MEGWSWRDGFQDLEDLLGGLEDQGWCLACGVYGHTVAVCPFQSEEEEERSEERGRMRGERRKSCRRQQKQWQQLPPRVVVVDEWCPGCGEFGHTVAICPTQYQGEEWMTQMVDWVYQEQEGRERKLSFMGLRPQCSEIHHVITESLEKKINELKQAKVTLNPDTANPSLTVSEDSSQVRFKGEGSEEWPSVLGIEGFTSGRHYWEVEVGEKGYWALGVSSIHPNEKIIPEKPEEGYWLLRRWRGNTYEAVSQSPVLLTLQHKLYKVGMILDCEKKKLSFYNVYDGCKRYKIHTFTYKFTEVYPIFSPGSHDRGPLKIIRDKSISNAPS